MTHSSIVFYVFLALTVAATLGLVIVLAVLAKRGCIPRQDNSFQTRLLKELGHYSGIGLIGILAVSSDNWFAMGMAVAAIGLLVADERFVLSWWTIVTRNKRANLIIRELNNGERQIKLDKKEAESIQPESADETDDTSDDNTRPGGSSGGSSPTGPRPSPSFNFGRAVEATLDDIAQRLTSRGIPRQAFRSFVEISTPTNPKDYYDGVLTASDGSILSVFEVKYLPDPIQRNTVRNICTFAPRNQYPTTFVLIVKDKRSAERIWGGLSPARKMPGVQGLLLYVLSPSGVDAVDSSGLDTLSYR